MIIDSKSIEKYSNQFIPMSLNDKKFFDSVTNLTQNKLFAVLMQKTAIDLKL